MALIFCALMVCFVLLSLSAICVIDSPDTYSLSTSSSLRVNPPRLAVPRSLGFARLTLGSVYIR